MTPKENMLRVIKRENPSWVPNGMEGVITIAPPVTERPSQTGFDVFGVHWSLNEKAEGGTYPTHGGHPIKDIKKWREQLIIPDISTIDWTEVKSRVSEIDRNEYLIEGFVELGLFERSYLLMGMEGALTAYMNEPEDMFEMLTVPC